MLQTMPKPPGRVWLRCGTAIRLVGAHAPKFVLNASVVSVMHPSAATRANMVLALRVANGIAVQLRATVFVAYIKWK